MGITCALLYITLGLGLVKSATSMTKRRLNCTKPGVDRLLKYDLDLIEGLYNDLAPLTPEERQELDALPPALMGHKPVELKLVNSLSFIIEQRDSLSKLGDSDIVFVLKRMLDTLYNDTCKFLNSKFGMDCSNIQRVKRDLLLIEIKLLTQAAKGAIELKEEYVSTNFKYMQLDTALSSNCTAIRTISKLHGVGLVNLFTPYTVSHCSLTNCGI